jgi:phosphoribosylglycinamide formyltransferase-1
MQAVVDAARSGVLPVRPAVLVCNNRNAEVVSRSQQQGIPCWVLNSVTHPDPEALDQAMLAVLQSHRCDVIVLAGFMKKIGPRVLGAFQGRIINIHPSLLPKHGGQGMYGRQVHQAVLAARETMTGVTIHLVNAEYDEGRMLAQCEVPVAPDDTVETLAARVLLREHAFLVETLVLMAEGKISL